MRNDRKIRAVLYKLRYVRIGSKRRIFNFRCACCVCARMNFIHYIRRLGRSPDLKNHIAIITYAAGSFGIYGYEAADFKFAFGV